MRFRKSGIAKNIQQYGDRRNPLYIRNSVIENSYISENTRLKHLTYKVTSRINLTKRNEETEEKKKVTKVL